MVIAPAKFYLIIIIIIIIIINMDWRLNHGNYFLNYIYVFKKKWSACLTTDHEVAGSIPGTSANFKCGLDLERGSPSLVRTIG